MKLTFKKKTFDFAFVANTSRDSLRQKVVYYFVLESEGAVYISECSYIEGLSRDRLSDYELVLKIICESFNRNDFRGIPHDLSITHPSIQFGLECLIRSLKIRQPMFIGENHWTLGTKPLAINGLIWMNDIETMQKAIYTKVHEQAFSTIKIKVGQHDLDEELELLHWVRSTFGDELVIRLDANGGFHPDDARYILEEYSYFNIHSIEQPIAVSQWDAMEELCRTSEIPIALDEELIAYPEAKKEVLSSIMPAYIILKPSLLGGFVESDQWIQTAKNLGINYWATSALETAVGLNYIAQWASSLDVDIPQGLGTGQIYSETIPSPLELEGEELWYNPEQSWNFSKILEV